MDKIDLEYKKAFSGQVSEVRCEDFTDDNTKEYYLLDDTSSLRVRNDGTVLYISIADGRCYVSSNRHFSTSLFAELGIVYLSFDNSRSA